MRLKLADNFATGGAGAEIPSAMIAMARRQPDYAPQQLLRSEKLGPVGPMNLPGGCSSRLLDPGIKKCATTPVLPPCNAGFDFRITAAALSDAI